MSNSNEGNETSKKGIRKDARRNRDILLEIAQKVFTTQGISVSMDEIAKHAGVGVGTVYRHFPNKQKLFEAVMISHKSRLIEEANQLINHEEPGEAFFSYLDKIIREGISNKAITDALIGNLHVDIGRSELASEYWSGIEKLLVRAQQEGYVRSDVEIEDIKIIFIGILQASGDSKLYPSRAVSILFDGLKIHK
ncbi:TetR/AcrR family transcriptional regulator [Paenibacillus sp. FSL R7-0331]|uniref:TetR/AcrR family transcriptional regulator n=1 Tax=Paenibacillus sp. FSL R7-0331 TaxID=1536773 RepID=UPI0005AA007A|nr:TetR/AcrR family transcriptional regulator [Paenibacillus sp. FSL R7-0331]